MLMLVRGMLKYIYSSFAPNADKMAVDLLKTADRYCTDSLKIDCELLLCEMLRNETMNIRCTVDLLHLADTHNATRLRVCCMHPLFAHSTMIIKLWKDSVQRIPTLSLLNSFVCEYNITKQMKEEFSNTKYRLLPRVENTLAIAITSI